MEYDDIEIFSDIDKTHVVKKVRQFIQEASYTKIIDIKFSTAYTTDIEDDSDIIHYSVLIHFMHFEPHN